MMEKKIVITVGRFSYCKGYGKGYDTVMRLAEKMPQEVGFFIIGDDPTDEFIKWKKEKNLSNVHFVGFKTKNELKEYYIAADIFILLSRGDIWGLVINEAMAHSLPIITTYECIAGTELVKNGINGFLVYADSFELIKKSLLFLLEHDCLREKYGNNSFNIISNYTIEKMATTHIHFFEEILNI